MMTRGVARGGREEDSNIKERASFRDLKIDLSDLLRREAEGVVWGLRGCVIIEGDVENLGYDTSGSC